MLKQFHELALIEGEGLGTAYEYLAKYAIIKKYLDSKKVLVYGLPEKYGFSLDFLYLFDKAGCEVHVYEESKDKVKEYSKIIEILLEKNTLKKRPLIINKIREKYDLILSCEVIQQLNEKRLKDYFKDIKNSSKNAIIFFPNRYNNSHCSITGLKSYKPEDISKILDKISKEGFIDMPPFPPGLKIKSPQTRHNLKILLPFLNLWLFVEKICPKFIKKNICHISYIEF